MQRLLGIVVTMPDALNIVTHGPPVVSLDACDACGMVQLSLVVKLHFDRGSRVVAFAFARARECTATWLALLKGTDPPVLEQMVRRRFSFFSDNDKGCDSALATALAAALKDMAAAGSDNVMTAGGNHASDKNAGGNHVLCANHVVENIKRLKDGDRAASLYWRCALAPTMDLLRSAVATLWADHGAVANLLQRKDVPAPRRWQAAAAHAGYASLGLKTNSHAEAIMGALKIVGARECESMISAVLLTLRMEAARRRSSSEKVRNLFATRDEALGTASLGGNSLLPDAHSHLDSFTSCVANIGVRRVEGSEDVYVTVRGRPQHSFHHLGNVSENGKASCRLFDTNERLVQFICVEVGEGTRDVVMMSCACGKGMGVVIDYWPEREFPAGKTSCGTGKYPCEHVLALLHAAHLKLKGAEFVHHCVGTNQDVRPWMAYALWDRRDAFDATAGAVPGVTFQEVAEQSTSGEDARRLPLPMRRRPRVVGGTTKPDTGKKSSTK